MLPGNEAILPSSSPVFTVLFWLWLFFLQFCQQRLQYFSVRTPKRCSSLSLPRTHVLQKRWEASFPPAGLSHAAPGTLRRTEARTKVPPITAGRLPRCRASLRHRRGTHWRPGCWCGVLLRFKLYFYDALFAASYKGK